MGSEKEASLEVSCREVKERLQQGASNFVLIDCREQDECALAKLSGARWMPMNQIPSRLSELEPHREDEIVIHCHHGGRSLRVAQWLREQGFSKSRSMAGGIDLWAVEIDPGVARY